MKSLLFWTPRVLGLLFALFVSVFALDVFGEGYGFWATLLALLMHLIPVFLLLIGLVIAWRWGWVGALSFGGFGVWYLVAFGGRFPWYVYWLMAGPAFLVGLLFLIDWGYRTKRQPGFSPDG